MNGVHDIGGGDGFGPVVRDPGERVFREPWEGRVFAMTAALAASGVNVHRFRHAIERMEPLHYLSSPYYEHWLTAAATLLVENGALSREDLEAACRGRFPLSRPVSLAAPDDAAAAARAPSGDEPKFAAGSLVRVRNEHPRGHTRCPRYVRGRRGVVARVDARMALPDLAAHAERACRQFQYCVRFEARELWGEPADRGAAVHVDLWEGYLEPA